MFLKNLMSLLFAITYSMTCFSQTKLDLNQDRRIEELEKKIKSLNAPASGKNYDREISKLKSQVKYLQSKLANPSDKKNQSVNLEEIKNIDREIEKYRKQIWALKKAVKEGLKESLVKGEMDNLEKSITSLRSKKFTILNTKISNQKQEEGDAKKIVSFEGLVELDVTQSKSLSHEITSQVSLATLELATEIQVSDYVKGNILIEMQDTNIFEATEAFIKYGNSEETFFNFRVGKMVIPFGQYETSLFSDPLGKSLGETNKNVLMGEIEWSGLILSSYIFKGDEKKAGKSDRLRQFGVELGYVMENENWAIQATLDYLSNFADSDTLSSTITSTNLQKEVSAYAVNLVARYENFSLVLEHLSSNSRFDSTDLAWNTTGAKPTATQYELSYTQPWRHETTFSLGYQTTSESVGVGVAETRILFGVNSLVNKHSSIGFEHFIDEDYLATECSGSTCGTGQKGYTSTVKFALIF